jgi:DnaJ-class molecular chaperone
VKKLYSINVDLEDMTRPTPENPWAVLGLDSTADKADVKRAFRNLAMQYHPVSTTTCACCLQYPGLDGFLVDIED